MTTLSDVTTTEEFHGLLNELFTGAQANGVDVTGGWTVEDGARTWDVVVTELSENGVE